MRIAGAGLAGLLAAHAWPQAEVFEASPEPRAAHRAVLRFRTETVAQMTGIPFRRVIVRKGIWSGGRFEPPSIRLANQYSRKVLGGALQGDRSIWSLEPVERFIAPESLYEQMVEAVGSRIHWGTPWPFAPGSGPTINTAPLPKVLEAVQLETSSTFERRAIRVERYRIPNADVFQTIYFPDPAVPIYRASITGNLLIVEGMSEAAQWTREAIVDEMRSAFGVRSLDFIDEGEQRFGKIVPLPDEQRRALLLRLTQVHDIFSLGRFATWRNVLLDDVVKDIGVIRRLLRAGHYERRMFAAR